MAKDPLDSDPTITGSFRWSDGRLKPVVRAGTGVPAEISFPDGSTDRHDSDPRGQDAPTRRPSKLEAPAHPDARSDQLPTVRQDEARADLPTVRVEDAPSEETTHPDQATPGDPETELELPPFPRPASARPVDPFAETLDGTGDKEALRQVLEARAAAKAAEPRDAQRLVAPQIPASSTPTDSAAVAAKAEAPVHPRPTGGPTADAPTEIPQPSRPASERSEPTELPNEERRAEPPERSASVVPSGPRTNRWVRAITLALIISAALGGIWYFWTHDAEVPVQAIER